MLPFLEMPGENDMSKLTKSKKSAEYGLMFSCKYIVYHCTLRSEGNKYIIIIIAIIFTIIAIIIIRIIIAIIIIIIIIIICGVKVCF